jgi:competence protein ComEC
VAGCFAPGAWEAGASCLAVLWGLALASYTQHEDRITVPAALIAFAAAGWTLAVLDANAALNTSLRACLLREHGPAAILDEAGDPVELTARLGADAARLPGGVRLDLEASAVTVDGREFHAEGGVLATVAGEVPPERVEEWRAGRLVRLPVLLRRPSRYMDPGVPDHELALARRGVTLVGIAKSAMLVETLRRGSAFDELAASIRRAVRQRVDAAVGRWDARSAAIVKAILLGDRAGLDDRVELRLQEAGTYHVLAISGGNVAILAAVMIGALRLARVGRRVAEAATAVWLVFYAFLVGGGASVDRATLMAVTYLAAHAVDHRNRPMNSLLFACGAGLSAAPLAIFDPAFWLTFGATGAILAGVPRLSGESAAWWAPFRHAWLLFGASLAAEAGLLPVGAFVFSRVTFAGLVLNFLAIPLMTVVQVAGIAAIGASWVSASWAASTGYLAHLASWALVESAGLVQVAPWLSHRLPPPGPFAMGLYYSGWALWLGTSSQVIAPGWRGQRARWLGRASLGTTCLAGMWILFAPGLRDDGAARLKVTFIDVGQGDAALLQLPTGFTLLVDTGGAGGSSYDIGQRVVEPVLWARGVRRIDYLLVTHGDGDHLNGAAAVVRDFSPREVWEGVPVPRLAPLQELRKAADRAGMGWRVIQRGDLLHLGPVELQAWHPGVPEWERQKVRNDDSVVLEVRYGDVSILLAGDIGPAVEADLARIIPPAALRVLKAPHHGSQTSNTSAFVAAVKPAAVVVSVGRGNRFGHPSPVIVRRYEDAGARVFRTDLDGAVTLTTDGRTVELSSFTGRKSLLAARRGVPPA